MKSTTTKDIPIRKPIIKKRNKKPNKIGDEKMYIIPTAIINKIPIIVIIPILLNIFLSP